MNIDLMQGFFRAVPENPTKSLCFAFAVNERERERDRNLGRKREGEREKACNLVCIRQWSCWFELISFISPSFQKNKKNTRLHCNKLKKIFETFNHIYLDLPSKYTRYSLKLVDKKI